MPATNDEFRMALEDCWSALNIAYWASSTAAAKDAIFGCLDFVSDLLDVAYVNDFQSRTTQFSNLADEIEVGNKKLSQLKKDIDKLIHKVDSITKVLTTIEKVISYIPLLPL